MKEEKPLKLIRIGDISYKTTMSESTIWMKVAKGEFIAPAKMGGLAVWKESDVDAWIESLFDKKDKDVQET